MKKKVLIIDDSALVRKILSEIINSDPGLEVADTAMDPLFALQKLQKNPVDVVTLDIEMPRMDGISFLKKLMTEHPLPVVMISSMTAKNAAVTIEALALGAVDFILKPADLLNLQSLQTEVIQKIKNAAAVRLASRQFYQPSRTVITEPVKTQFSKTFSTTDKIIAIGSSTGGTVAIEEIIKALPVDIPGIVIVQHMPEHFTKAFAERLNSIYPFTIKEAQNNDQIKNGFIYIAPGNRHMTVKSTGGHYMIHIIDGPPMNGHKPSVSILFNSVANNVGKNAIGIMLTGMGEDGAHAMKNMKDEGSHNIAQDEESCVVFGMPKKAVEYGAVHKVLPLKQIPAYLVRYLQSADDSE